jgi:hypothetical protein
MTTIVTWRAHTFDSRTRDQLVELERLWGRPLDIMQGSYNPGGVAGSSSTHDRGGAFDADDTGFTAAQRDRFVTLARTVGFACWWRPTLPGKWGSHFHGISIQPGGKTDQGVLSSAAFGQVRDYYNGLDGLAGDGPDPHRGLNAPKQTWEQYKEDNMPLSNEDVQRIAKAVWAMQFREYIDEFGDGATQRSASDILFATHKNTVQIEKKVT